MEIDRIQDLPQFRQTLDQIQAIQDFQDAMPILQPLLEALGINPEEFRPHFEEFKKLKEQIDTIFQLPDRFNDLLSDRGWIIYERMNFTGVATQAVKKAEEGDIEAAEQILVNYYNTETIQFQLNQMKSIQAFQPRLRLARKALSDYEEARYHACIPVVLALMDGLVNELHEKRRGFFSDEADMEAWDSVSAHSKGLGKLAFLLRKSRQKTTTEPITIPFRNGILHGMDLGYDNKLVAAKTWATLFALRDWAMKAEKGLLKVVVKETPSPTLSDALHKLQNLEDLKAQLAAWKPRDMTVGVNVPATGNPDCFEAMSPERKLAEFLQYWKVRNYGTMAQCVPTSRLYSKAELPARIRDWYSTKQFNSFEFVAIVDKAAAVTEIETILHYEEHNRQNRTSFVFRMIYEDADGETLVRGTGGGMWTVYNWSFFA